jgi:hypothetical protein
MGKTPFWKTFSISLPFVHCKNKTKKLKKMICFYAQQLSKILKHKISMAEEKLRNKYTWKTGPLDP